MAPDRVRLRRDQCPSDQGLCTVVGKSKRGTWSGTDGTCGGTQYSLPGDGLTVRISYMPLSLNACHCQGEPFCLTRPPRIPLRTPTLKAAGLTKLSSRTQR